MVAIVDDRETVRLPRTQLARMDRLRREMLDDLQAAVEELNPELAAKAADSIARIKASGYDQRVIRREVKGLVRSQYDLIGAAVAGQIQNVATMGVRYEEMIGEVVGRPYSASATSFQLRRGGRLARTSLATEALLAQPTKEPKREYVGNGILREHVRPWREARMLSKRLHGRAVEATKTITNEVIAATREAKQLTEAASSLIRAVRKARPGGELAANERVSALVTKIETASRNLDRRGGPAVEQEWSKLASQLRKRIGQLAEGGRIRSNLVEMLQHIEDGSKAGLDRALIYHTATKQQYAAERILKTEQQAAFKAQQVLSDQRHPEIVAYIWHMNRAARRGYVKRTKPGKTFGRGRARRRRCVCEELDGRRISKEVVAGRDARLMAHPHCKCWLEPVFDKRAMLVASERDLEE